MEGNKIDSNDAKNLVKVVKEKKNVIIYLKKVDITAEANNDIFKTENIKLE